MGVLVPVELAVLVPDRVRFATLSLPSLSSLPADDSSKERFGERVVRVVRMRWAWGVREAETGGEVDVEGGDGVGEREGGSGIWEGSDFDMDFRSDEVEGVDKEEDEEEGSRNLTLGMTGFFFGRGEFGRGCGGVSCTEGRPECGPLRFLIEEKCSQS